MRQKVNDLLASGASYAMTLRALGDDSRRGNRRFDPPARRETFPRAERRQGHLPGDPGAPG